MAEKIKAVTFFKRALYRNLFPQIPTLTETNYFLQFNGYEIFLPQRFQADEALNIFELSVLKFKELGNFSANELSDKLCLKEDFVRFILIRLTELGLLDDKRQITETGLTFLGEKNSAQTENIVPYLLLVSRDTGEIFPSFFPRQNQLEAELEKPLVKIFFGSTGEAKPLDGRCVFVKEKVRRPQTLPQRKIRDALRKFNRNVFNSADRIFVEAAANIQSTYTQPIFLHVKAVLQDGNVDYEVVSDGQSSHSDFLRDYLKRQNPEVLTFLQNSAKKIFDARQENSAPDSGKYFEIRKAMRWEDAKATTVDEIERSAEKQRRQLENLSKAIEWALYYHLLKFPPPQQLIQTLSLQTPEENFKTLTDFAAQLDLDEAKNFPNFFRGISSASVKNCMTTKNPTLVPLLAVNIATAVRVADSNLLTAFKALPEDDAFGFLQRLDGYGKKLRHEDKWTPAKKDTPAFLHDNVLKFIQALLPDYDNPAAVVADLSNASLKKLNAQLAVKDVLGEETFQNLSKDLQALTLKVAPDKNLVMPLPVEFVTVLSMILEKILSSKLAEFDGEISLSKAEIIDRLTRAGKSTELRTVGEEFYLRACKRQTATLGAYALAYMATLSDARFDKFAAAQLPELISRIAQLRGHSNNLALVVDAKDLSDLRDKVFAAITFLEDDDIGTDNN